jgi:hypothetical protein
MKKPAGRSSAATPSGLVVACVAQALQGSLRPVRRPAEAGLPARHGNYFFV